MSDTITSMPTTDGWYWLSFDSLTPIIVYAFVDTQTYKASLAGTEVMFPATAEWAIMPRTSRLPALTH